MPQREAGSLGEEGEGGGGRGGEGRMGKLPGHGCWILRSPESSKYSIFFYNFIPRPRQFEGHKSGYLQYFVLRSLGL